MERQVTGTSTPSTAASVQHCHDCGHRAPKHYPTCPSYCPACTAPATHDEHTCGVW